MALNPHTLTPPLKAPVGTQGDIFVTQAQRSRRGNQGDLRLFNGTFLESRLVHFGSKKDKAELIADWAALLHASAEDVKDALTLLDNGIEDALRLIEASASASLLTTQPWMDALKRTKGGDVQETYGNLILALQHTAPWETQCWYDVVRELPMCETEPLSPDMVGRAALDFEQHVGIPVRNLKLAQAALVHHCRATPRDELQAWLLALPAWDRVERLDAWLSDVAGAPKTAYGMDVSRLLPVSMVARALQPGCQYRNVVIFEGPENLGKSKLVKALASPAWYREVSHSAEGKEAHMILQGAWVAEWAEMSTMGKTAENRLKSYITMESDDYIPKFANAPVSRKRRTIFVGTINPEGDSAYFSSQTGSTRYLPIPLTDIKVDDLVAIRDQLFAEALGYYRTHPTDWWKLSADGETQAAGHREARRQASVYEAGLRDWLISKTETTWDEIAQSYLQLEAKEKWKDRALQMEVAKGMRACGWVTRSVYDAVTKRSVRTWGPA